MASRYVANKRDLPSPLPYGYVYVGRPTRWGNPFTHINGRRTLAEILVPTREEAIRSYRQWLLGLVQVPGRTPPTREMIKTLKGQMLVCWCSPKPCHADVLAEFANEEVAP